MSAVQTSARQLLARGRDALRILEVLLEDEPKLEAPRVLKVADGRYRRLSGDLVAGTELAIPDSHWKFTLDQETGLVWTDTLGDLEDGQTHEASMKIAEAHQVNGVSFVAPTIRQQLSIIDYERYDPAVDTRFFRGPYGWHWTRTRAVKKDGSPSDYAWAVLLGGGSSDRDPLSGRFHVRACCPSQSLGIR
jgi:Asp-tRNA(Asn)/Glu-tRNA(Gln) amidotransferase A subunit family amidase